MLYAAKISGPDLIGKVEWFSLNSISPKVTTQIADIAPKNIKGVWSEARVNGLGKIDDFHSAFPVEDVEFGKVSMDPTKG